MGYIGNRVLRRLDEIGMSKSELARRAKVDRTYLYLLFADSEPSATLDTLRRLARALRLSVSELIGEESIHPATPYDADAKIRAISDSLAKLTDDDREEIVNFVLWVASKVELTGRDHDPRATPSDRGPVVVPKGESARGKHRKHSDGRSK